MDFSRLDRQITIQQKTISRNEVGEEVQSWSTFATCFAQRLSRPGNEFYEAGKINSEELVYFLIRHVDGLDTAMRVLDGSLVYDLTSIGYSEQRRSSIQLSCKRVS